MALHQLVCPLIYPFQFCERQRPGREDLLSDTNSNKEIQKREKAEAEMQRCIYGFQIPYEMNRQVSETIYDQTVESQTSRCTNYEQLQFGPRRIPKTAEQWCVKR
ncbi:hypothetical protein Ancab_008682 [Ancistrocladus abbreviatus]